MIELSPEVAKEFEEKALFDFPREACGLVAVIRGRQQFFPCPNIADQDSDFVLDPASYIRVEEYVSEKAGEIVAVLHSHPVTAAKPSMADLAGCESSGLEWFIYSIKTKEWVPFQPSGYKAPLIGRPFRHGVFDCYSALRDWYREKLGKEVIDFHRDDRWWEQGQNLLMDNFEKAGFSQVLNGTLEVGDVLLINLASPIVNHCAVYIGNDQIFHQTMNRLSSREIYGGHLKKNTRMVLRYTR